MASTVFFYSMDCRSQSHNKEQKVARLCKLLDLKNIVVPNQPCAIKLHFGEEGNDTHINPAFARVVAEEVRKVGGKPFLTDTNTLYSGSRHNSVDHILTAIHHGFAPGVVDAPVIIADGLFGNNEVMVEINAKRFQKVRIAGDIAKAPSMVVLSHFKGHEMAGFGGAIKNLAMGCASPLGKQDQHGTHVTVDQEKCIGCGHCVKVCPQKAMSLNQDKKCVADKEKCFGCFECMTVCEQEAIQVDWATEIPAFMERLTEYGYGAIYGRQDHVAFINFVMNVTPDCDCVPWSDKPMIPDVGILASTDPVALDQACFDLVQKAPLLANIDKKDRDLFTARWNNTQCTIQLEYGEKLGMGSRKYELKELS